MASTFLVQAAPPPPAPSAGGWTTIDAPTTGNTYYIAYDGSDSADGLSRGNAWLTIGRLKTELGTPGGANDFKDHHVVMDFPSGNPYSGGFGQWKWSGADATHPMRIYSHTRGSGGRIFFDAPNGSSTWLWTSTAGGSPTTYSDVQFFDCDAREVGFTGDNDLRGLSLLCGHVRWLFENCYWHDWNEAWTIQSFYGTHIGLTFNRCAIANTFKNVSGHTSGAYVSGVQGLSLIQCVFDRGGWDSTGGWTNTRSPLSHGIYIQHDCTNVLVDECIAHRGAGEGIKVRCGGTARNNLLLRNPIGLTMGDGTTYAPAGIVGHQTGNVVIESEPIDGSTPRGIGIYICNLNGSAQSTISGNYVVQNTGDQGSNATGIYVDARGYGNLNNPYGIDDILVTGNYVRGWGGLGIRVAGQDGSGVGFFEGVSITNNVLHDTVDGTRPLFRINDSTPGGGFVAHSGNLYHSSRTAGQWYEYGSGTPRTLSELETEIGGTNTEGAGSYADPDRNMVSYMAATVGSGGIDEFMTGALANRFGAWNTDYTAAAVKTYIVAGFA